MIAREFTHRCETHTQMVLADFLDSRATREGFVGVGKALLASQLKFPSTWHVEQELLSLERLGLIEDLALTEQSIGLKMLEPRSKYVPEEQDDSPELIESDTIYDGVLAYWNELAAQHKRRLVRCNGLTPDLTKQLKRAWRNPEFRKKWKRAIRVVLVDEYFHGRRLAFASFIRKKQDSPVLWAIDAIRIFDEHNRAMTDKEHLILYPEPTGWRSYSSTTKEWAELMHSEREAVYAKLESGTSGAL